MNILTETQKAYIAGFFDGEGCVSIGKYQGKKNRTPTYQLMVVISQKDDVLHELRDMVGIGSVCGNNHTKGRYYNQWRMSPKDGVKFLEMILPYLRYKANQAELAIEFQSKQGHKLGAGIGYTVPQHLIDEKERYYQSMKDFKGNGSRGRPKKV